MKDCDTVLLFKKSLFLLQVTERVFIQFSLAERLQQFENGAQSWWIEKM